AQQTIDVPKPADENETEVTRVDLYAAQAVRVAPLLIEHHIHYMAIDSFYTKYKFVTPVVGTGLNVVGKLRSDANLRWLFKGNYSGLGRPKRFDGKVNSVEDLHRFEYVGKIEETIQVYSAVLYSVCLERDIKVVMLICNRHGKSVRVLLFSTDTKLDATTLISYYKARFQIEFVFRDAKQFTGLLDCQARNKEAIHTHINASLAALNVLKFEDALSKESHGETVISIASWKRRKFNQHLMKIILSKLDIDPSDEKVSQVVSEFEEYGAIAA
ncbi:transposase, partial [Shewanella sp. 202IG2-18]|uniref:transposase n=1 Tax=Parashewanella hymeniacidonis TaxID=2807618 RepID=UPI001961DAE4